MSDCKTCYGHGLWLIGDPCPMGPMDAAGGMPTQACPECHANPNGSPREQSDDDKRGSR